MKKNKKYIYFLGEGNSKVGMGHISRLVAISMQLKGIGLHKIYLINPDDSTYKFLEKFKSLKFQKINHASQILEFINENQILILDGYNFSSEFLNKLKLNNVFLVYIDDLNDKFLPVDIIINHTNGYSSNDYDSLSNTKFFLGKDYSILRSTFLKKKFRKKIKKIQTIFLSLGFSKSNLLEKLILKVIKCWPEASIYVLSGNNLISHNIFRYKNITVIKHISESKLCKILDASDLSIVPVSTLYLESLSRNTIVAAGYFINNQKLVYDKLVGTNTIFELGDFRRLQLDKLIEVKKRINKILPIEIKNNIGSGWSLLKKTIKKYYNEKV